MTAVDLKEKKKERSRMAFVTPLRIETAGDSLSLYTSRILLPLLSERFEIDLFSDFAGDFEGRPVFHHLSLETRDSERRYDTFFYQLEDSRRSGFVRIHLAANPGVCLFHNYFLRDDGPEPILNSAWPDLLIKYHKPESDWPSPLKAYLKTGKAALRESLMSAVPIFSSPQDQIDFSCCGQKGLGGGESQSFFVPVPVREEIFGIGTGDKKKSPTVLYAGKPGPENRSHKILEALSEIRDRCKLVWLAADSELAHCKKQLSEFDMEGAELIGGRSPEKYGELLASSSVSLVPYFSPFGNVSPWFEMSIASGVPTIGSDFGWADYLPGDVIFKVAPGESEARYIRELVLKIVTEIPCMPGAVEFAREMFSPRMVAAEMEYAIERSRNLSEKIRKRWSQICAEARGWILKNGLTGRQADDISLYFAERLESAAEELGWRG